jgi:hypothetical protein
MCIFLLKSPLNRIGIFDISSIGGNFANYKYDRKF